MRLTLLCLLIFSSGAFAQTGGNSVYKFLNLSAPARIAALGGSAIATPDSDLNLAYLNPAMLNQDMKNQLVFSGVSYFADINYGYAAYANHFDKFGTFALGIHYVDYGTFLEADDTGLILGEFDASDYSINLSWSKKLDSLFSFGASAKTIFSNYETYSSTGVAADIGFFFYDPDRLFAASIVVRNAGRQLTTYDSNETEPLPLDIQLGISKKLEKAPFRFSLIAHNLQKWDLTYQDPAQANRVDPITGESLAEKITFGDKLLRHLIINAELLLSKNFHIRTGYNFQRRNELGLESRLSIAGLSWGFEFRVSKFKISYGSAKYHLAGSSNHFTVSTNISDFYKKK
ncbi:MAG: type IX secretion system protein PorQ [Bacteroidia bacterium]|nr:type IX secretion system protein PorQ [Bacteroidia bacterium]